MGLTKDNNYSTDQIKFSQLGKAIGHPARVKILDLLNTEKIIRFEQLHGLLNLGQPTIRVHLEKLKDLNLINEAYIYHTSIFTINIERYNDLKEILRRMNQTTA